MSYCGLPFTEGFSLSFQKSLKCICCFCSKSRMQVSNSQWSMMYKLLPVTSDLWYICFCLFYISPCSHMSHAHVLCLCISKISICDPLSIMCTFCMNCPIYLSTIHPCFPWPWCYLYTTQRSSTLGSLSQIIHLTVRHMCLLETEIRLTRKGRSYFVHRWQNFHQCGIDQSPASLRKWVQSNQFSSENWWDVKPLQEWVQLPHHTTYWIIIHVRKQQTLYNNLITTDPFQSV